MNDPKKAPRLSVADLHVLAELIVEQDGVTYAQAMDHIQRLTEDAKNPSLPAADCQFTSVEAREGGR